MLFSFVSQHGVCRSYGTYISLCIYSYILYISCHTTLRQWASISQKLGRCVLFSGKQPVMTDDRFIGSVVRRDKEHINLQPISFEKYISHFSPVTTVSICRLTLKVTQRLEKHGFMWHLFCGCWLMLSPNTCHAGAYGLQFCGDFPWPKGSVLGLRPPGFEFQIFRVIWFISPSSQGDSEV